MENQNLCRDIILLSIGAGISLVSSVIILFIERFFNKRGKLRIFYMLLANDETGQNPLGFRKQEKNATIEMNVPLALEISNTSNTARIIRNVVLALYNGKNRICQMDQIMNSEKLVFNGIELQTVKEQKFGADNNSYSFVVAPVSIQKQNLLFEFDILNTEEDKEKYNFDSIRLEYYDEKNRKISYCIADVVHPWDSARIKNSNDWIVARNGRKEKKC